MTDPAAGPADQQAGPGSESPHPGTPVPARNRRGEPLRVVFVCLGNICRSPMAAAVMRERVARAGLDGQVEISSAGTGHWHVGEPADRRARATLRRRGYDDSHTARQFQRGDFDLYDLVLGADASNVADLRDLAPTPASVAKVRFLRSFDPASPADAEVPDPYFGHDGFDHVLDLIEAACDGLVDEIQAGAAIA